MIDYKLDALLKEAEQVLHVMPSTYNPHPHYPIKQFDHPMTSEQLEQRATAKRLRPFLGKKLKFIPSRLENVLLTAIYIVV
ncbi:hypothetical protein [Legionella tunisiensis]|uniref:hypothetical protein n=1 Tax=Legionella tunisiensis TaxID=1034944 RepID=UPI00031A5F05|nr:hypothetical protein [Legionella tunisiensis]